MEVSLAGRALIVTGAASGVGREVARCAAGAGAELLLTDRDAAGLDAVADDLGAARQVADLVEPDAPDAIAAAARVAYGRIDGLVNAAALTDRGALTDADPALWERLFAVNARAPFFLMQQAVRDMQARAAPGAIVNILSVNAHCGAPDLAVYSATKGALLTLTKNAARAHMAERIRVNGINLGWTLTEGEQRMQAETLGNGEDWAEALAPSRPLGRLLRPEEAARQAVWLLSDASAPLSGVAIDLEQKVHGAF
ncbi:short chain dehydrogenase [Oceanicola granulosus HTCC2516]|uniref:Short chain dehydrogenase n=1 Tax=Oceanicola granulosus (strain ATCC BAA-861 / DSM 15982 / KCTC 12143 / HTCC2516) TaxID=314256 RepID=Q2CIQ6_OCEGH|nr:oxidoreductase [Oceanicola granulosus]EAR52533.1 short chain dehydrogenase [Oceanicola granulosus HTCC2516]